jgi:two-component system chemotaxis sensor kinase CheA
MSDPIETFKRTFFEECGDLLSAAETHLGTLTRDFQDPEAMAAIFRAVHSIKGGAGAFGFERLVAFSHIFESALDLLRADPSQAAARLDRNGQSLLMRSFDMLSDLVADARGEKLLLVGQENAIARALAAWQGQGQVEHGAAAPAGSEAPSAASAVKQNRFRIRFTPAIDLLRHANEPLLLFRELRTLAAVSIQVDRGRLPDFADMEPDGAYLAWVLDVVTDAAASRIAEVFEFVADDSDLTIQRLTDDDAQDQTDAATNRAAMDGVGGAAVKDGAGLATADLVAATSPSLEPSAGDAARSAAPALTGSIRVNLEKVDRLVNMVGEIVITQAMLSQQIGVLQLNRHPELVQELEQMAHHVRELQENVMSIRAQPVRSVFARMPRLVRELADELGKEARVVTVGEGTEVDKTVIEQLSDPLTHLVRNAVDHGIEAPDIRLARGKPREGTIVLSAEHRSGRVVIEIAEDGNGIDRDRVRAKAIRQGLISPDAALSPEEIENFIFLPGFSTAERISNISGRGVGMDVVKRNIQALGGRVHVASKPGQGSRFSVSLPLTLAVLDGMIVTVASERYIVPLTNIIESLRPRAADISRLGPGRDVLAIRGAYVPLVYLARALNTGRAITDPTQGLVVLVEVEGGEKIGLVVDEMLGQQQVVIKSLEANYRRIGGISAATILGDGRVALILDVGGLRQMQMAGGTMPHALVA